MTHGSSQDIVAIIRKINATGGKQDATIVLFYTSTIKVSSLIIVSEFLVTNINYIIP
jgi:hypothetical protein